MNYSKYAFCDISQQMYKQRECYQKVNPVNLQIRRRMTNLYHPSKQKNPQHTQKQKQEPLEQQFSFNSRAVCIKHIISSFNPEQILIKFYFSKQPNQKYKSQFLKLIAENKDNYFSQFSQFLQVTKNYVSFQQKIKISRFINQHFAGNIETENDITITKRAVGFLFDYSLSSPISQKKLIIIYKLIASVILLQIKCQQQIIGCFSNIMNQQMNNLLRIKIILRFMGSLSWINDMIQNKLYSFNSLKNNFIIIFGRILECLKSENIFENEFIYLFNIKSQTRNLNKIPNFFNQYEKLEKQFLRYFPQLNDEFRIYCSSNESMTYNNCLKTHIQKIKICESQSQFELYHFGLFKYYYNNIQFWRYFTFLFQNIFEPYKILLKNNFNAEVQKCSSQITKQNYKALINSLFLYLDCDELKNWMIMKILRMSIKQSKRQCISLILNIIFQKIEQNPNMLQVPLLLQQSYHQNKDHLQLENMWNLVDLMSQICKLRCKQQLTQYRFFSLKDKYKYIILKNYNSLACFQCKCKIQMQLMELEANFLFNQAKYAQGFNIYLQLLVISIKNRDAIAKHYMSMLIQIFYCQNNRELKMNPLLFIYQQFCLWSQYGQLIKNQKISYTQLLPNSLDYSNEHLYYMSGQPDQIAQTYIAIYKEYQNISQHLFIFIRCILLFLLRKKDVGLNNIFVSAIYKIIYDIKQQLNSKQSYIQFIDFHYDFIKNKMKSLYNPYKALYIIYFLKLFSTNQYKMNSIFLHVSQCLNCIDQFSKNFSLSYKLSRSKRRLIIYLQKKIFRYIINLEKFQMIKSWEQIYKKKINRKRKYQNNSCMQIKLLKKHLKRYQLNIGNFGAIK